jgi:ribosomal protein S1
MMQSLNNDQVPHPNAKYNMGDEIDVKVISVADNGFILTIPTSTNTSLPKLKSATSSSRVDVSTLTQGQLVNGVIRSLKGQCAFVQISGVAQLVIGRLHKLESSSGAEYEGFSVGESINAKILKISKGKENHLSYLFLDGEKTWIELTRRKEHMNRHGNTLDEQVLKQTLYSLDDLKAG